MGNSIVVVRKDDKIMTALFKEKELVTIGLESTGKEERVGDIFIGKVQNIVKNIKGAFVEIDNKRVCFLPLEERIAPVFCDGKERNIRIGDELLVQISKETRGVKAPLATAGITLTGRLLVLAKGKENIGVSSKISDESTRERLKDIVRSFVGDGYGFIVRTNAATAESTDIEREARALKDQYEKLINEKIHCTCFSKIYSVPAEYILEVRNGYSFEVDSILTDDREIYDSIKEYLDLGSEADREKLSFYDDKNISLSVLYGLESKLQKALQDKVWLDSGAYLVIQPTEALVSIDVNTGKAIAGKNDTEETFFRVNCEAALEIAAQLRLRNLSGIIIVDFIDMKKEEHRKQLLNVLRDELAKDHITTRLIDMTPLGLVEITRQRIRKSIYEL
ncbi:MAG: ribonuclease E/G [Lachnospiraceae bacterium]|nr:ribonuclease E/G [Lachnospiraceae bacterium]